MSDIVHVPDAGMRAALAYHEGANPGLSFDDNHSITKSSLARVRSLAWCPEMEEDDPDFDDKFIEIEDLSALRFCPDLRYLVLNHNSITSLEPLRSIGEKLKYVHLHFNPVESLDGLENKPVLETLELDYCRQLKNIAAIKELPKLKSVNLNYTAVADFSPLLKLPSLKMVYLGGLNYDDSRIHEAVFTELAARGVSFLGQYEVEDWVQRWAQQANSSSTDDQDDSIASLLRKLGLVELERIWEQDGVQALSSKGRTILSELAYIFGPGRDDRESFEKTRLQLVRLLVDAGADVNADHNGTVLTRVLEKREPDLALAEELLSLGADPNLPTGKPAIATVLGFWYKNHPDNALAFVDKLIEYGADLENKVVQKSLRERKLLGRF